MEIGTNKVDELIAHRQAREDQIVLYLSSKGGQPENSCSSEDEITDHIYADQNLNWIVRRGAKRSVKLHLQKLLKEGKVEMSDRGWNLTQRPHAE